MTNKSKWLLEVNGLHASVANQMILKDINLQLTAGESLALVGGSGAGKSSLLRCLLGFNGPVKATSGSIRLANQQFCFVDNHGALKRKSMLVMAYVPQNPQFGLDPLKKLAWQWSQAKRCAQIGKCERVEFILDAFSLKPFNEDYPHQWSFGMQQRLLLAFALLKKPQLLILDEPTSALDHLIGAQVMDEIAHFAKLHNIALLMVTHDLAMAARFTDRIAVLDNGKIVEDSPSKQLLTNPQSSSAQQLVNYRYWPDRYNMRINNA